MFTVIIVVCLLKRMCMQSFVLIGCCVSKLHGQLCPYRNVLPEAIFYKNYIVYKHVTFLFHGCYGYLTVRKVSILNSIRLLRYVSRNWRRRRRTTTTTKWRTFILLTTFPLSDFGHFLRTPIFWCLLPRKRRFSECMGAMLANHHDPYIQRGYRPFVIQPNDHMACICMLG